VGTLGILQYMTKNLYQFVRTFIKGVADICFIVADIKSMENDFVGPYFIYLQTLILKI